jgi:hypothetical protein
MKNRKLGATGSIMLTCGGAHRPPQPWVRCLVARGPELAAADFEIMIAGKVFDGNSQVGFRNLRRLRAKGKSIRHVRVHRRSFTTASGVNEQFKIEHAN